VQTIYNPFYLYLSNISTQSVAVSQFSLKLLLITTSPPVFHFFRAKFPEHTSFTHLVYSSNALIKIHREQMLLPKQC